MNKLVILVVNEVHQIDPFLMELSDKGIKGATIFESKGMGHELVDSDDYPLFTSLVQVIGHSHAHNRTIMIAIHEEQVPILKEVVKARFADFKEANTGIMLILPIEEIDGIKF